jgi:hypothetical protein
MRALSAIKFYPISDPQRWSPRIGQLVKLGSTVKKDEH